MLSNPNMSLSEFASRFGFTITPFQERMIRAIEEGQLSLPIRGCRRVSLDYKRPIAGGWLEKDTLTGEVHEPLLQRREDWS